MTKLHLAAILLVATPMFAQQSGVSNPPDVAVEDTAPVPALPPASAAAPVVRTPADVGAPADNASTGIPATAITGDHDDSPAVTLQHRDLARFDPDGEIVGDNVVDNPNVLATGTMLRASLQTLIKTDITQPGTPFRAEVTQPVMHDGRVVVPAGAVIEGHVTDVRGGRRLHGPALIHLQAQTIILPDGTRMPINASVIDTDKFADTRIDQEGNIIRKDHAMQTFAEFSLAAGSTAAVGGLVAGVPGALIGAGVGAGVGTFMWLKADRQTELPPDTKIVLALDRPLPIQPLVREPDYSAAPGSYAAQPAAAEPPAQEPQAFVPLN